MKFFQLVLLSLLVLTLGVPVLASPRHDSSCGKKEGDRLDLRLQRMQVMLDLAPDQQARIRQILQERQRQTVSLRQESEQLHTDLRQLRKAQNFDLARARELASLQADNRVRMMGAQHMARQQIEAVLTPGQLEKHEQVRTLRRHRGNQQQAGLRGWTHRLP